MFFVVKDRLYGRDEFVFSVANPRDDGYTAPLFDDQAELVYDMSRVHRWPQGTPRPSPELGRNSRDPHRYQVFRDSEERSAAGFHLVGNSTPTVVNSWPEYVRRYKPKPEDLANIPQDDFLQNIERFDSAAALRNQRDPNPEPLPGSPPDHVAAWIAKQHMGADGGISEVCYLPHDSPPNEIRLLEVSELFTKDHSEIEPFDYALKVAGQAFKLYVADVSRAQLSDIRRDPSKLPEGWSTVGAKSWGRGE